MPAHQPMSAYQRRAEKQPLRFNENGTFQISVFSDFHFAEGIDAEEKREPTGKA